MMRRLFYTASLLLIPLAAWAAWSVGGISSPASVGGITSPASVGGITAPSGGTWNTSLATDANLLAWYEFDNGALSTDSKGSNTLNLVNVTADTTTYQRGTAAARIDNSSASARARILSANLPSDWPGKAGASDIVSVVYWIYHHSTNTNAWAYGPNMYDTTGGARSWASTFKWDSTPDQYGVQAGYNSGASYENYYSSVAPVTGRWYYVAMVIDGVAGTYRLRVYDYTAAGWVDFDTGTSGQQDMTGSYTNSVFSLTGADFYIGQSANGSQANGVDASIDDLMVFKDALSVAEINAIQAGTY